MWDKSLCQEWRYLGFTRTRYDKYKYMVIYIAVQLIVLIFYWNVVTENLTSICSFFSREKKSYPWKKNRSARERKSSREKVRKSPKKSPWKWKFSREIFPKIPPAKPKSMPVKEFNLFPREIENKSLKNFGLCPWNRFFYPWKKNEKSAREKKVGVKNVTFW